MGLNSYHTIPQGSFILSRVSCVPKHPVLTVHNTFLLAMNALTVIVHRF